MATKKLFNARTQQTEDAEFTVDDNNEIVATFADGGFVKFPAGIDAAELERLIAVHEEHNVGQEVITPEFEAAQAAEKAASYAAIGETTPANQEESAGDKIDVTVNPSGEASEEGVKTDASSSEPV